MKIQIIKKAVKNAKPQGFCAFMVEVPMIEKR